jgi:hypothetical protein
MQQCADSGFLIAPSCGEVAKNDGLRIGKSTASNGAATDGGLMKE